MQWRRGSVDQSIFDNFLSVQVQFLPLRWRGESISPTVATDHQSVKRGEKAVTWHPTRNPVEQSGVWTGTRIHVCIVVTLHKPTRSIGLGQNGTDRGWATLQSTQRHSRRNPAKSGVLHAASYGEEERSNPVSFSIMRRCQPHTARGGIPQEANASGKARGYADVGTVGGRWEVSVTPKTL